MLPPPKHPHTPTSPSAVHTQQTGQLYELDGRRAAPVAHGPTSGDTLLADVARVAQSVMAKCVFATGPRAMGVVVAAAAAAAAPRGICAPRAHTHTPLPLLDEHALIIVTTTPTHIRHNHTKHHPNYTTPNRSSSLNFNLIALASAE
jgi:hypothetical protein